MDDNTNPTQANQPQQRTVHQPHQQPEQPVGGVNKEQGPIAQTVEAPVAEFLKKVESEPKLQPEVKEAGVETAKETPRIAEEIKQVVTPAKEAVPVQTQPSGAVQFPLSQQQAQQVVQTDKKKTSSSMVWLASLILKLLKKKDVT